jgi:hypothetical protein
MIQDPVQVYIQVGFPMLRDIPMRYTIYEPKILFLVAATRWIELIRIEHPRVTSSKIHDHLYFAKEYRI